MMEYKLFLSVIAIGIGIAGYVPYFRDIFRGATKPHFFSWFIWALLTGIAFLAQLSGGGGVGAWVTGITALLTFAIALLALFRGERNITRFDWVCFVGSLLGVAFWILTSNALWAVVIVTVVDLIAFIPTFRKGYMRPYEETVTEYVTASIKFILSIMALQTYSVVTWLYPASLIFTNAAFAIMALQRRSQLKEKFL